MNQTPAYDVVVIGGGMAANRLISCLAAGNYVGSIALVGAETTFGYNRVLLPDLVAGNCGVSDLGPSHVATGLKLTREFGQTARSLDLTRRSVQIDDRTLSYRKLVLATGSRAPTINLPGQGLSGVTELRTLDQAQAMIERTQDAHSAVVVGGGLLGLEAAKALLERGLEVRVVHRNPAIMNRQLDAAGSHMLQQQLEHQGFKFSLGTEISSIQGEARVRSVTLSNAQEYAADLVVFATGAQPQATLAEQAGLHCQVGITANTKLETSTPDVYALGECAIVDGTHYTLVDPIYAQAKVLADNLLGANASFVPAAPRVRLKVAGIELFTCGNYDLLQANGSATNTTLADVTVQSSTQNLYRRLIFQDTRLAAAVLIGDTRGSNQIFNALQQPFLNSTEREKLAFGI